MDITLQDLINAAQTAPDKVTPADAVAKFLVDNPGADVVALQTEAIARFQELHGDAEAGSDAAFDALEVLDIVVAGAKTELARRDTVTSERRAKIAELAKRVAPPAADEPADEVPAEDAPVEDAPVAEVPDAPVETPAAPVAEVVEAPAAEVVPEPIAAAAAPRPARRRVDIGALPRRTAPVKQTGAVITAAADVSGFTPGQHIDFDQVAKAANTKFEAFPTGRQAGVSLRAGVARIAIPYPQDAIADGNNDQKVINHAASVSRVGKSLVAAGGWCAPSDVLLDLGPSLAEANVGLVDIPEVSAPRGGLRFTEGPDYTQIWSGVGWGMTETQAIAGSGFTSPIGGAIVGTEKPCYRVPCPAFGEERAEAWGFCITSGILQNDAYPELTRDVIEKAVIVHAHRINARTINRMVAESGAAIVINLGPSATPSVLNSLDAQITDYRYLNRMSDMAELEVVLPLWLKAVIRADQSVRTNSTVSEAYDVTDQRINAWFAARKARVQWVYDWQDAFTGVAGGFGSATAILSWPDTVQALIYAAGTFVRARGEVISLDAIYDTNNLPDNDYQALWVEEKLLVIKRRWKARLVTIALSANGATGCCAELDADGMVVA